MCVDLIKPFDSISYELLFKLLGKFGIPDRIIMVIKNIYKTITEHLMVGKCVNFVDYSTGVKQRDLAPILFIIVMQFVAELLEKKWRSNKITKISFYHNTNAFYRCGKLIKYNKKNVSWRKTIFFTFVCGWWRSTLRVKRRYHFKYKYCLWDNEAAGIEVYWRKPYKNFSILCLYIVKHLQ